MNVNTFCLAASLVTLLLLESMADAEERGGEAVFGDNFLVGGRIADKDERVIIDVNRDPVGIMEAAD